MQDHTELLRTAYAAFNARDLDAVGRGLFVMFAVAYVGPFLLTNADPRFRIPLDILVLTHAISRFATALAGGGATASATRY